MLQTADRPPRGILRANRLNAQPKQLSFDVPPSPAPSPKSSNVSSSGSYVFERYPRNAAKRQHNSCKRDPARFRLAILNQRSNSESMFRMHDLRENGIEASRRMSMAYLPTREQALLRRILGPQGLSWINPDRENTSRKSVSIAYSNDLEAQKSGGLLISGIGNTGTGGGDDSETPLVEGEEENNSGGRLIKREILHDKRRIVCDRALAFSILGILLMIIESELRSSNIILAGSVWSLLLKLAMMLSTAVLLVFVALFHVIEIQLFMNANAADDWRVSITRRRAIQVGLELLVCALQPIPLELGTWYRDHQIAMRLHTLNVFLSICMFFRLYWLCRVMLLHSRLFTDASSRSIAGLNRVNFNARFILKTLMTICPGQMLMLFTASLWIIAGWILRICEREYLNVDSRKDFDYVNSIWLVAITFLSVGYGDIVPRTYCGRMMAVITGILGTCASSMVVAVIARKLELTRAEKHVHNFMMDTQLTKQLKHSAANVLRETWFIYKYRKLCEKVDFAKIRMHQRKFLVAIYEMRRVKREQRKLAENLVSLGDVAKTSSNTYELVHDVHSTQEGLCLRVTAIEHTLSDIQRELSALSELLRSSRKHSSATCDAEQEGLVMRRSLPRRSPDM
ncbi:hypothetical protein WR25_04231 [Diploscapter pachys]|uniref:Calmodulin-binding domain-containing protein n=1 Tax=Diploscapter pachys TaxID=2018661 RepID=A0A2A2K1P6_9BILA|nr:hypothetical protein WR25_04231 [Diploscapter pachys]